MNGRVAPGGSIGTLKALVEPGRLRILGLLSEGPRSAEALAEGAAGGRSAVDRHLRRLEAAGLVGRTSDGRFELRLDALQRLGRELDLMEREAESRVETDTGGLAGEDAKILRSFIVDGRLESIPAQERKRLVILRYLRETCFAEDRAYPEKEVNQRLALFHPDVAALRRYLVDSGLMRRAAGEYRRAG